MDACSFGWVNGCPATNTLLTDRGVQFGDGLFETLLIEAGCIRQRAYHLDRLRQSAARLGLAVDMAAVQEWMLLALAESTNHSHSAWRLKLIVTRGSSLSGFASENVHSLNYYMLLAPLTADRVGMHENGVKVRFCDWRLSSQPRLAGIKHLNRLDQVMARREWKDPDIYEGLMRDQQGRIIEGISSNLFVVDQKGRLITPGILDCGVKGTLRQMIIDRLAPARGLQVMEKSLLTLKGVREVFITNALIGIVPVIRVDHDTFSKGTITRQLQVALQAANNEK